MQNSTSSEEVEAAIKGLSDEDMLRLEKAARYFAKGLGRQSHGRDYQDLLQEGLTSLLEGRRAWDGEIDFSDLLHGVIKSIAWAWRTKSSRREGDLTLSWDDLSLESDLKSDADTMDKFINDRQIVEQLESHFSKDRVVLEIMGGWQAGMKGPEIREALDLTEDQYRASVRRMRRNLPKDFSKGGST